jgi:hypothetical protein
MNLSWIANTTQGRMVGDYISTSIVSGRAWPVLAVATAPSGSTFNEGMFVPTGGLDITGGARSSAATPVVTSGFQPNVATLRTAR